MFAWARAASSVVEHLTFNQGVPGSIPGRPTTVNPRLHQQLIANETAEGCAVDRAQSDMKVTRFPFAC
jgi:hypothetical protein